MLVSSINDELRSISKRPNKALGQNFLTDRGICLRIVENTPLKTGSLVTEIGPGLGVLTKCLLEKGYKVRAIELDRDLAAHLKTKFQDKVGTDLEIIHTDAIRYLKRKDRTELPYIISNLPYNISSQLIGYLLDTIDITNGTSRFNGAVIMFQKEFGKRLIASKGGKEYGKISVMFNLKMDHEVLFIVPKERFFPQPKVDGIVIRFSPKKGFPIKPDDDKFLRSLVNAAFLNRRKKLKNSILPRSLNKEISEAGILNILKEMGLEDERPEQVSPEKFTELSNRLLKAAR